MEFKDIKYLAAFIIPFLVFLGLYYSGIYSFAAFIFAFVIIPLVEPFFLSSEQNLNPEAKVSKRSSFFFDFLLILNLPLIAAALFILGQKINSGSLSNLEIIGYVLSFGTFLGACGINVAHELGHKENKFYKLLSVALLLPSFYTHFIIEHNRGHHKNVGTPKDPASAKKGDLIYSFWVRSIIGSYINAWKLEHQRIRSKKFGFIYNAMIWFTIMQIIYALSLNYFIGTKGLLIFLLIAIISVIFLESINYIEHYGLRRQLLESGRYERVMPKHSWNSNHYFGRIVLYELTRHSDHHYLANKKYQILDHHDDSPQLPFGYPAAMIISLIPPLWFKFIHPHLD
ncbi:MAG: alkane 1-monooxygenase [Saprospiraceae bacterium]|nr:alkane 1-monooxygenase [Saprospiraceae bacterium]